MDFNGHVLDVVNTYPHNSLAVIVCQGSQNYGLDTPESDLDTRAIILPNLKDLAFNRQPISHTIVRDNDEHIDVKDVRLFIQLLKKQNLNFVEVLFSPHYVAIYKYAKFWDTLCSRNEEIARYNPYAAVQGMAGHAYEKYFKLKREGISRQEEVRKFSYDRKQLMHLIRIYFFLEAYVNEKSYWECMHPTGIRKDLLMEIKAGEFDLPQAEAMATEYLGYIDEIRNKFPKTEPNKEISDWLDEQQYRIIEDTIISSAMVVG